jgi:hypothetical protein
MPTITNPGASLSAYRPVQYEATSDTTTQLYTAALVTVYNAAGAVLAAFPVDWYERTTISAGNYRYKFKFDISGIVRAVLFPFSNRRTATALPFNTRNALSTDTSVEVYVTVSFNYRDTATNLVTDAASSVTSATSNVFATARQHTESQNMGFYLDTTNRQLLHDAPAVGVPIFPGEAFTVSFIHKTEIVTGRLTALQTNGVTDVAYFAIPLIGAGALSDKKVHAVGVGPRNLAAIPPLGWIDGFSIAIDETIANYTIDFGSGDGSTYSQITEQIRFTVEQATPSRVRLHWLNDRGAFDAYTFDAIIRKGSNTQARMGRRGLIWTSNLTPHDSEQRQVYRIGADTQIVYELESRFLPDDVAEYVSGIMHSVEVYAETAATKYVPVVIGDGKVIPRDNEQTGIVIKLTVTESAEKINLEL